MKRLLVSALALSCLLALGTSYANADHFQRSRSGLGISISYGGGYNGFNVGYNRGYHPVYHGGYGGYYGGGFGGYPVYHSAPIHSVPVYSVPVYGGGYGHHHHHHHCW